MTVIIPQHRPGDIPLAARQWTRPVTTEVLASLASSAAHIAAVRGCANVSKTWNYSRDTATAGGADVLARDPVGTSDTYSVLVERASPHTTRVEVFILYQAHDSGSSAPRIDVTMLDLTGGAIDSPLGGIAVRAQASDGSLSRGGSTLETHDGARTYDVRSLHLVADVPAPAAYPSGPRALEADGAALWAAGKGFEIRVVTNDARVLRVDVHELSAIAV